MEHPEALVFFYVPKVSFRLGRVGLAFQNTRLTLNVPIGFFFQFFPLFIDLHHLIAVRFLFGIVLIKAPGLVLATAAIRASIYLYCPGISILFLAFRTDMAQLFSVMADVNSSRFLYLSTNIHSASSTSSSISF